ncbi:AAA family ATPase [Nonomuraea jabiensis]|uniref:AAA family ATPase n=1 Tax=Nonomuraea jabiensis TaxID=882448 RepID=UPI003D74C665
MDEGILVLLAGAPGSGKSTLLPHLLKAADGLVVMDMDELLEDGRLIGVPIATMDAAPVWPAYDRMWTRIVTMVRRAGHPVLLLCPVPDAEELAPGGRWTGDVHCALLDCSDTERLRRLRARGDSPDEVEDAMVDAARARTLIPTVFHTDNADVTELATRIADYANKLRPQ